MDYIPSECKFDQEIDSREQSGPLLVNTSGGTQEKVIMLGGSRHNGDNTCKIFAARLGRTSFGEYIESANIQIWSVLEGKKVKKKPVQKTTNFI